MPFQSQRPKLILSSDVKESLSVIQRSRMKSAQRVERAKMMMKYASGKSVSAIARELKTNRPRVGRCIDKALEIGALPALNDLGGRGQKPKIGGDERTWIVNLACQKPKDLGYSYELWTTALLAKHARKNADTAGYPTLRKISRGTISKILTSNKIRPHKINYYLERRDPEFDIKMAQVLFVYKQVEMLRKKALESEQDMRVAILSYDEKPGIQAIENTAPDLLPTPGKHESVSRDYEYVRHGTLSLMAGIDLLSGHVHGVVVDRNRSREFIGFLENIDQHYPQTTLIRIVLDNHSAHISKETRAWLAKKPNRFEFIFTPKHGSWLNMIETFFGKMAKSFLRGIRVQSKEDLKKRIMLYLQEVNESPVVFRWKYKMDDVVLV